MSSKAFQQICDFLDKKELKYRMDGKGTDKEIVFFGTKGLVQQRFLFTVETEANVVQFRSVQILDENDLKNYHGKPDNRVKLFEYLLKCNYEWKLGKFALDPEDPEVDLYFVISDFVDASEGIEEEFLDRVHGMLLGPSFAPSSTEKAIKDIKSILATGERSEEDESSSLGDGELMKMIAGLASDPELAKSMMADPNTPQMLKDLLAKALEEVTESPEQLAKKAQELLAQGKIEEATAIIAKLSGNTTPSSTEDGI